MQTLLDNIAMLGQEGGKEGKAAESKEKAARLAVAEAQVHYELSTEELASLSEEGESIGRLQAILIKEHNDVSGATSPLTKIQIIKHMRAMLKQDEREGGVEVADGMEIPEARKLQLMEFTGYRISQLYQTVKFAQLSTTNYDMLMKINDYHADNRLQGQSKKKRTGGEEEENAKPLEYNGLEYLVGNVDEQAIKNVFEELIEGKRNLKTVKEFTFKWVRSNSK
jgi:hypothetical protein